MKVIAVNGSARKHGNTEILINAVFAELEAEGIETETLHIGGAPIRGCAACMKCWEKRDGKCAITSDGVNGYVENLKAADGVILASPSYFANVSSELKAFIDRVGMVAKANGDLFMRKPGAAVVAVRRSGEVNVFDSINHFFLIGQMIVVGSSYWNNGIGLAPGDVSGDDEGMTTMKNLGRNMAWLLKKLER
jgi:multimeric flavodoxin WrbA